MLDSRFLRIGGRDTDHFREVVGSEQLNCWIPEARAEVGGDGVVKDLRHRLLCHWLMFCGKERSQTLAAMSGVRGRQRTTEGSTDVLKPNRGRIGMPAEDDLRPLSELVAQSERMQALTSKNKGCAL